MVRPRSKTVFRPSTAPVIPLAALPSLPSTPPSTRRRGKTISWSQKHKGTPLEYFVNQSFAERTGPRAYEQHLTVHYPSERERPVVPRDGNEKVVDLYFTFSSAETEEGGREPADERWGRPGCYLDAEAPLFWGQNILKATEPVGSTSAAVEEVVPGDEVDGDDETRGGGGSSAAGSG